MIRHLFTLTWNRKRANGLPLLEIALAFVVLFAVGSVGVYNWRNYRTPLGFAYEHVWEVDTNAGSQPRAEQFATLQRVLQRLRSTPGVVSAARSSDEYSFLIQRYGHGISAEGKEPTRQRWELILTTPAPSYAT